MNRYICATIAMTALLSVACSKDAPAPYGVLPSPQQIAWQKMEMNMFVHFGPNTFTSLEWGNGTETEDIFNPTDLDCLQWARTAAAAGFGGIVITAKHHDGFCLWPNPESTHTVASSTWRDGKGDVLKDLSEACSAVGIKFGVYVSPWDRNDPRYGTPAYNEVFVNTLRSVLDGSYGPVYEQWFDGANGEGPTGRKQVYDWPLFNGTVYENQPDAIIFSDCGPGCRWVGNERGEAGRTSWSTIDVEGYEPGMGIPSITEGKKGGASWIPSETDVSIRKGWFWKERENETVKSLDKLLQIWYESVGRNSLLLLNVPPDTRGHIHEIDSTRLMEFRAALDEIQVNVAAGAKAKASTSRGRKFGVSRLVDNDYDTYWAARDGETSASIEIVLPETRQFNRVMIQEYIALGQRVESFTIEIPDGDGWKTVAEETTIGYKRIVPIPQTAADRIRINITSALACPVLNNVELYQDNIYAAGL